MLTAALLPENFNSNNTENDSFDSRSDNKGPEPEGITVGEIDGRTYTFIGFERVGGIINYGVTNPSNPTFVDYINNRDFSVEFDPEAAATGESDAWQATGDLAPEGLTFISAEDSPNGTPLLAVANEVSGTTTLFEITSALQQQFDILFTGSGNRLLADAGKDILFAENGGSVLTGGDVATNSGLDIMVCCENSNAIADFQIGADVNVQELTAFLAEYAHSRALHRKLVQIR